MKKSDFLTKSLKTIVKIIEPDYVRGEVVKFVILECTDKGYGQKFGYSYQLEHFDSSNSNHYDIILKDLSNDETEQFCRLYNTLTVKTVQVPAKKKRVYYCAPYYDFITTSDKYSDTATSKLINTLIGTKRYEIVNINKSSAVSKSNLSDLENVDVVVLDISCLLKNSTKRDPIELGFDPSVMIRLGYIYAKNIPCVVICDRRITPHQLPFDINVNYYDVYKPIDASGQPMTGDITVNSNLVELVNKLVYL